MCKISAEGLPNRFVSQDYQGWVAPHSSAARLIGRMSFANRHRARETFSFSVGESFAAKSHMGHSF